MSFIFPFDFPNMKKVPETKPIHYCTQNAREKPTQRPMQIIPVRSCSDYGVRAAGSGVYIMRPESVPMQKSILPSPDPSNMMYC